MTGQMEQTVKLTSYNQKAAALNVMLSPQILPPHLPTSSLTLSNNLEEIEKKVTLLGFFGLCQYNMELCPSPWALVANLLNLGTVG